MLQTVNIPSAPIPEPPGAMPGSAPDGGGDNNGFAQLLQRARSEPAGDAADAAAAPGRTVAHNDRSDRSDRGGEARQRSALRSAQEHKLHDAQRPRGERAGKPDASVPADANDVVAALLACEAPVAPATDAVATSPARETTGEGAAAAPVSPDAALTPRLQASVPAPVLTPRADPPPESAEGAEDHALNQRLSVRIGNRDVRTGAHPEAAVATAADAAGTAAAARETFAAQTQTLAETANAAALQGSSRGALTFERAAVDVAALAAANTPFARELQAAGGTARSEAGAAQATLHLPLEHEQFAPAFGAQVAVWVRDGVQEARLQLHPAELGPVTVQIALDGTAAHVDFTAAVAATRDSIEQSLPALAAALRESGFTLAGGGVFGRASQGNPEGQRERHGGGRGRTAAAGSQAVDGSAPIGPGRWARSLLDVYA